MGEKGGDTAEENGGAKERKKKRQARRRSGEGRAEGLGGGGGVVRGSLLWRSESDRGANRVASDDGPAGECRLCQWSGTNGAREGMQLPAPEEGYCATGQGSLTRSQDGGLEGGWGWGGGGGGAPGAEKDGHVRSAD